MTGELVEGIIIMLVIVFAIFYMVKKSSRQALNDMTSQQDESAEKADSTDKERDKN
ncbi:hypothetical protein [Maridesulfovibrio ferrireducens]|uniref:hypothetical protein n=1 Tax=Maridesulfovibrio ferrireducens TaxID=246191 RepID=UPI001A2A93B8|nr:hypothetical protein [Maridesulfovibrio ferrireducens]MBI9110898.1 hypothetical protein [Maridesulfovibrio ferrireducens]